LKALLAPTQTELPFLVVLALFVVLTVVALIRFHGESKELGDAFIAADRHPYR
jgi:hypothetical protein